MIRGRERFLSQMYMISDFIAIQAAFLLAWFVRFEVIYKAEGWKLPFQTYMFWSVTYGVIALFIGFTLALYMPKRKKKFAYEVVKVTQVHVFSMFMLLSVLFIFKEINLSRLLLALFLVINIFLVGFYRYIVKINLRNLRRKGYNKQFILILGAGSIGRNYYNNIMKYPEFGFEVTGFLDDFRQEHDGMYQTYQPIMGKVDDLEKILEEKIIDEVVIALPLQAHQKYQHIVSICEKAGVRATIIPDFHDVLPATPHFDKLGDIPIINVRDVPLDEIRNRLFKRWFDIAFSLFAIILTSPVMLLIVLGIKLTSPGPIIFKQERVGLNRRNFMMYKFRSMKHMPENVSNTTWTTSDDPRKTKFGSFLRKTSLDELPQFFNVLKGDMSVVGPRPERPYFVDQFKEEVPKYMIKHHVRPGITGWAQVCGLRGDTSIKDRIIHDVFYIENWTLLFDVKIIFKTIVNGFVNRNAY